MKSKILMHRNSQSSNSPSRQRNGTTSSQMTTSNGHEPVRKTVLNAKSSVNNNISNSSSSNNSKSEVKKDKDANNNEECCQILKMSKCQNGNHSEKTTLTEQTILSNLEVGMEKTKLMKTDEDVAAGDDKSAIVDENGNSSDYTDVAIVVEPDDDERLKSKCKEELTTSPGVHQRNGDCSDDEKSHSSSASNNTNNNGGGGENKTNLIVNYLPQNMSQEEMRELFSRLGEVESCKLVRDKITGQSLSYGFVNYLDAKVASTAIHQFNGLRLQNKVIKVSLARPSSETIKGANLYICGLPKSMTQPELEQLFNQYGKIITCRILVDNATGNSKGVAFIRFDQRYEAEVAIKRLNGFIPAGGSEPITVKLANTPFNIANSASGGPGNHPSPSDLLPPPPMPPLPPQSQSCPQQCSTSLRSSEHSPVSSAAVAVATNSPNSEFMHHNGMAPPPPHSAFSGQNTVAPASVTCPSQILCPPQPQPHQMHHIATFPMSYAGLSAHHAALHSMSVTPLPAGLSHLPSLSQPLPQQHPQQQQHMLEAAAGPPPTGTPTMACLFVYNLAPDTKEANLWQTFGPFGAVHSVSVARDNAGNCRGFGIVCMPNYHEAILALQHLNGYLSDVQLGAAPELAAMI